MIELGVGFQSQRICQKVIELQILMEEMIEIAEKQEEMNQEETLDLEMNLLDFI